MADTKAAPAHIGDDLQRMEVDGTTLWFDQSPPSRTTLQRSAFLVPVYDEAVLTYLTLNFPVAQAHPQEDTADPFWAPVLVDRTNLGLWKRTVNRGDMRLETCLAPDSERSNGKPCGQAGSAWPTFSDVNSTTRRAQARRDIRP